MVGDLLNYFAVQLENNHFRISIDIESIGVFNRQNKFKNHFQRKLIGGLFDRFNLVLQADRQAPQIRLSPSVISGKQAVKFYPQIFY